MKLIRFNNIMIGKKLFLSMVFFVILTRTFEVFSQNIRARDALNNGVENPDFQKLQDDSLATEVKLEAGAFYLDNIFDKIPFKDTLLDDDFPYFDPLEVTGKDIVDKGYIGSAAMVLGEKNIQPGFDFGYHQYDLYDKNMNNFKWYNTNVPFASLFFSPGSDVNEFWTQAKFAKDFKDVSVNIDYSRLINSGVYKGQKIKHSDLNVGFRRGSTDSKYNTFFNFITNIHQEEDNGGVQDISYLSYSNYSIREVIPVNLQDAVTRLQDYTLVLNEYYRLQNRLLGAKAYLYGKLSGSNGFYKFYDDDVSTARDATVYGNLLVDEIGLRNYIKYNKLASSLGIWAVAKEKNYAHIGLSYDLIDYNIEPLDDSIVNQLNVYFKGKYGIFDDKLNLKWNSKCFMYDLAGDYLMNAELNYQNRLFSVATGIELKKASPPLRFQMLYLTRKEVYNNSFEKSAFVRYFAGIDINKLGFSMNLEKSTIKNYLYFDESLFPQQLNEPVNLFKLHLKEKMKISIFHLAVQGNLYKTDSDAIPLPKYTLKMKFFISPYLYDRHLFIKTGFEFNYWDKYYNYGYNPAISDFYTQNTMILDNFMRLDYFLSAKVKSFLFFIRFNNILFPLDNNVRFKVPSYPQNDLFYRLGVKWTLLN